MILDDTCYDTNLMTTVITGHAITSKVIDDGIHGMLGEIMTWPCGAECLPVRLLTSNLRVAQVRRAIQQLFFPNKTFWWPRHIAIAILLLTIINLLVIFAPNILGIFGVIGQSGHLNRDTDTLRF